MMTVRQLDVVSLHQEAALHALREDLAAARLSALYGVALVEVVDTKGDNRLVERAGAPALLVHEVGPGAGPRSEAFPPTPSGHAAALQWLRLR